MDLLLSISPMVKLVTTGVVVTVGVVVTTGLVVTIGVVVAEIVVVVTCLSSIATNCF